MIQEQETFVLFSINHENVPLEIRERYSLDDSRVDELYARLGQSGTTRECLILNTCNRFELYVRRNNDHSADSILGHLSDFYGYSADELLEHLNVRGGREAIQHMIEVCAGLRSQITGEAEIFGQVKSAYAKSQEGGYAGKVVNRVFQKGFQAAKLIRNSTNVGQGQINIANVAVELSSKIFGSLSKARALSIGTGEIGEKTVKALVSRGVKDVGVASRSSQRAEEVAKAWGGRPHTIETLSTYLANYDIVIASSLAEEPIITHALVKSCGTAKRDLPLFLIDLGLPRNIERKAEDVENVYLYNLDDLAKIAEENLEDRRQAIQECREIATQKATIVWENLKKRGQV